MEKETVFNEYIKKLNDLENTISELKAKYQTDRNREIYNLIFVSQFVFRFVSLILFKTAYVASRKQLKFEEYLNIIPDYETNRNSEILSQNERYVIRSKFSFFNILFQIKTEIINLCNGALNHSNAAIHDSVIEKLNEFGIQILKPREVYKPRGKKQHFSRKFLLPNYIAEYIFNNDDIAIAYSNYDNELFQKDASLPNIIKALFTSTYNTSHAKKY